MGQVMRRKGWEGALSRLIEDARERPFAWGSHDCATWAADCVMAVTGRDLGQDWRGRYRTARGAARMLRRAGFSAIADAASVRLGQPLPSPLLAQRGDVVTDGAAMGVCIGATAAFLSPDGLAFRPLAACAAGWRV